MLMVAYRNDHEREGQGDAVTEEADRQRASRMLVQEERDPGDRAGCHVVDDDGGREEPVGRDDRAWCDGIYRALQLEVVQVEAADRVRPASASVLHQGVQG